MTNIPRGIRNNNPGNIDFNPRNQWVGQLGLELGMAKPRFARFDKPENGIRAIAKLLRNYHKSGYRTVRTMINRWAPSFENNTDLYALRVAFDIGYDADDPIAMLDARKLGLMAKAIIKHENGYNPYSDDVIAAGVRSALL